MIDVDALFSSGGPLARALPSYELRPQQTRMAVETLEAIASGRHLLIEAGTGVGKSLAYLVPAILWATRCSDGDPDRRRVIVSTNTRALQEQLARKDLPFLERALLPEGIRFTHALLMGAENYLCVQRLAHARLQGGSLIDDDRTRLLEMLWHHAERATSGLRSEIPFAIPEDLWSSVKRDRDICLGARGPFWESCLYRRDLTRSREAHLLVVNHALFFLDLATGGRILPPHQVVILDEGHRVEEAAKGQFGITIGSGAVSRLLEDLRPRSRRRRARRPTVSRASRVAQAVRLVDGAAERFFQELRERAESLHARYRRDRPALANGPSRIVRIREAGFVEDRLRGPLEELEGALNEAARLEDNPLQALALGSLAARARDLRDRLETFLSQRMSDAVYWFESSTSKRSGSSLHVTPVDIAPVLRRRLFDSGRSVIMTSATLTAARSFAHVRQRLGLTGATEVALGSPFDFERQALLYLAPSMPDPVTSPTAFAEAVIDECRLLLRSTGGGAFVLFTSYALLRRAHEELASDSTLEDLRFFRHDPGGAAASILEEFRTTRRGVLLGTLTFWQGVDVPGEALRCVIITRLPFDVPDHPVTEARAELIRARGGDPFNEDSLPDAILTFRQGFGRLIRTREDRGLVAILDPRVRTRPYGNAFLESLPPCGRTDSHAQVDRFFDAEAHRSAP